MPRISVVMPVYNSAPYLKEAIESILEQTFKDFEFIILNDGSTDNSFQVIQDYARIDPRICVLENAENMGVAASLNKGMQIARGEYLVRMDADDISYKDRLQRQVQFMEAHPEVGICGTWVEIMGIQNGVLWKFPTQHDAIYASMIFVNSIVHPSIILRRQEFENHGLWYDLNAIHVEDYELWSRALSRVRFANIPEVLLKHRLHKSNTSSEYKGKQHTQRDSIYQYFFATMELHVSPADLLLHQQLSAERYQSNIAFLRSTRYWLEQITRANQMLGLIATEALDAELGRRWTSACTCSGAGVFRLFREIVLSPLPFENSTGLLKVIRAFKFVSRRVISRI